MFGGMDSRHKALGPIIRAIAGIYSDALTASSFNPTSGTVPTLGMYGTTVLAFATATTERMRIDASGNVGIGMVPVNRLDITQTQNASATVSLSNSSAGNAAQTTFLANSDAGTYAALISYGSGFATSGASRAGGGLLVCSGGGGLQFSIPSDLFRWYIGGSAYLTMSSSSLTYLGAGGIVAGSYQANNGSYSLTGFGITTTLDLDGSIITTSGNGIRMICVSAGVILNNGTNSWIAISARDKKKDVAPIPDGALALVDQLTPVFYRYKDDADDVRLRGGFIYEDTVGVYPQATSHRPASTQTDEATGETRESEEIKGVSLEQLVPLLTKGMQEQSRMIAAQDARIAALEARP